MSMSRAERVAILMGEEGVDYERWEHCIVVRALSWLLLWRAPPEVRDVGL